MRRTVTSASRQYFNVLVASAIAVTLTFGGLTAANATEDAVVVDQTVVASETTTVTDTPAIQNPNGAEKVFVCKYVGTPGVDERLQTGDNPISVSVNAIQNNRWDGNVPGWFSDRHDRSYVLAYDTGQPEPDVSECPGADVPEEPEQPTTPDPKVVYTEWVDGTFVCGDGEMIQTRTKTTTTYSWEKVDGEWVLIESVNTVSETGFRPLTDAEIESCKPEIPAAVITVTTVDGSWTCEDTEIPVTVTTVTTPWIAVLIQGSTWELQPDTANAVTETVHSTRQFEDFEIEVCETDPPAVSTPEEPVFIEYCGTANDKVQMPLTTGDWTYNESRVGNTATVVAEGVGNVTNPEGDSVVTWTHTFTDEACPATVIPTPTPTPVVHNPTPVVHNPTPIIAPDPVRAPVPLAQTGDTLPRTGGTLNAGVIMLAFGLLALGALLLVGRAAIQRRRSAE